MPAMEATVEAAAQDLAGLGWAMPEAGAEVVPASATASLQGADEIRETRPQRLVLVWAGSAARTASPLRTAPK